MVRVLGRRLAGILLLAGDLALLVHDDVLVLKGDGGLRDHGLGDEDAAPDAGHREPVVAPSSHRVWGPRHEDAVPCVLAGSEDAEPHGDRVAAGLGARGGPGDLLVGELVVLCGNVLGLVAPSKDCVREGRGGQRGRLGRAERVLDGDVVAVLEADEGDGAVGDTRLVPVVLGEDDVLVVRDSVGEVHLDVALPRLAALALQLGGAVDIAVAEALGGPDGDDATPLDPIVDAELQHSLSLPWRGVLGDGEPLGARPTLQAERDGGGGAGGGGAEGGDEGSRSLRLLRQIQACSASTGEKGGRRPGGRSIADARGDPDADG
mmetsp:Transcript_52203/g.130038  ORF Transcript_52203/g.130038 Transcript_52203/m.130038 type:complete len:320 (-) Transcript_52203:74-1033(-)